VYPLLRAVVVRESVLGGVVDEHLQCHLQTSFGSGTLWELLSPEVLHSSLLSISLAPGWGDALLTVK
jgi:hypothetical protein